MMEEKFRKYIEGSANPDEVDSVIEKLLSEEESEESEQMLSSYWQECIKEKTVKPSKQNFINEVHKKLGTNSTIKRSYEIYKIVSFVAVALLLVTLIGGIFFFQINNDAYKNITQTINTPYGARTNFDLPDGSRIWLNSGSIVVFPTSFKHNRSIQLTGEAFFEVKKSKKPFVVSTEYGDVEVLGTTFNVNAYDEELFQTTLVTGRVKILDKKELFLSPGYQYYKENNQEGKILKVNPKMFVSWVDGVLIFRDEPFKTVAKKLERWYNVKIFLKDKSLEELKYTGTIRMESFSEVLEILAITSSINFSFDEKTRVITITKAK